MLSACGLAAACCYNNHHKHGEIIHPANPGISELRYQQPIVIKPTKTKAEIRGEIDRQIDAYLQEGGAVATMAHGVSGRKLGEALPPAPFDKKPETTRTPVSDVVNTIEARKHPPKPASKNRRRSAQKILITDDFGDPVRWVWNGEE